METEVKSGAETYQEDAQNYDEIEVDKDIDTTEEESEVMTGPPNMVIIDYEFFQMMFNAYMDKNITNFLFEYMDNRPSNKRKVPVHKSCMGEKKPKKI